jgi:hypothetical protein
MKRLALALLVLAASIFPAAAQEYYDIDVDLPTYPEMVPVPDSPVYYAPNVDSNYFFYDGLYWDYYNDGWYSSAWYNGPWSFVDPIYVPTYILWVPIRFYRRPPAYFRGWHHDRPPRWGQHWGRDWQVRHNAVYSGQRGTAQRAPLPDYQRQFSRNNYPQAAQQSVLHGQQYSYQPREGVVQQHYQSRGMAVQQQQRAAPEVRREESRRDDSRRDEGRRDEGRRDEGRRSEGPREQRR